MSTLGQKPATRHVSTEKQSITGNGGTSYTLQQSVSQASDIEVFVNNTRQEPTVAYTASGTTLTMTGVVNASDNFYVIFQGKAIQTAGLPVDAAITASTITTSQTITSTGNITTSGTVNTPSINSGQIGGRRNHIINGAMEVAQRGTSSTSTGWGYYTVDRMNTNLRAGAGTMSQYTLNDELPPFVKAFKFAITSGSNSGQPIMQQKIEDSRKFKNRQVTLSFFARASKAITVNTAFDLLWANADNFTTAVDHSITTSWQRFTSTVTLPNPSGSYNSTYDHLYTRITTPLNDTFDFYITGLQVEYGATATEYEHRSFAEELTLCHRYCRSFTELNFGRTRDGDSFYGGGVYFSPPMRATPTLKSGASFTTNTGNTGTPAINSGLGPSADSIQIYNSSTNWTSLAFVRLTGIFEAEL